MSYSAEEIAGFEAKDRRIVRQSMLKAAVEFHTKQLESGMVSSVDTVLETANQFVNWVYSDEVKKEVVSNITGPTPTLDQKKALEKVEAETGWNAAQVYAKFKLYPDLSVDKNGKESWKRCINAIKELNNE